VVGTTISLKEIIASFARVLGKDVHYQEITDDEWRDEALGARLEHARGSNIFPRSGNRSARPALSPEAARFRGDRHDRKDRRRQAKDVRGIRARATDRTGHATAGRLGRRSWSGAACLTAALLPLVLRPALSALDSKALANTSKRDMAMSEPTQRTIESNGIRLNIAEQGSGPPGAALPRLSRILVFLAPPDRRARSGRLPRRRSRYARATAKSDRPEAIDQYTIFHLVGDMVGILDALGAPKRRHRRP